MNQQDTISIEQEINQESKLSIVQVAHITNIGKSTIFRYVADYRQFISLSRGPKNKLLFDEEALSKLVFIRNLTHENKSKQEIKQALTVLRLSKTKDVSTQPVPGTSSESQIEKEITVLSRGFSQKIKSFESQLLHEQTRNKELVTRLWDLEERMKDVEAKQEDFWTRFRRWLGVSS
jgi:DNA-binding transcriptional MerR regulator